MQGCPTLDRRAPGRIERVSPFGRWSWEMGYIFDPDELHGIAKSVLNLGSKEAMFEGVASELKRRHPQHINVSNPWIFNNAGGAMGQMKLLHASLTEYILIFGTPIGTEGHSGRYATEV